MVFYLYQAVILTNIGREYVTARKATELTCHNPIGIG